MDLTPGHTRARAALTNDERATLRQEGKCFKCCKKGHMSRDCPDRANQAQSGTTKEDPKEDNQRRRCANQASHSRRVGMPGPEHEPGGKGQSDSRHIHEGFLKYSDPTAWGRVICVLKCNTV